MATNIPGGDDDKEPIIFNAPTTGPEAAGGYNPDYKPPTKDKFTDPSKPYVYTTDDWQLLLSMSRDQFAQVQNQLTQIFPDQFRNVNPGRRDDPSTIYYFKQALGYVNNNATTRGKTVAEALPVLARQPFIKYKEPKEPPKLPAYQVTNPNDLKAIFRKTAQDLLGRTLNDNDLNRMVSSFQQQETAYQKQAYAGGGKVVQQAPQASTFAATSIQKDFGEQVSIRRLDNLFSTFDKALSGGQ